MLTRLLPLTGLVTSPAALLAAALLVLLLLGLVRQVLPSLRPAALLVASLLLSAWLPALSMALLVALLLLVTLWSLLTVTAALLAGAGPLARRPAVVLVLGARFVSLSGHL